MKIPQVSLIEVIRYKPSGTLPPPLSWFPLRYLPFGIRREPDGQPRWGMLDGWSIIVFGRGFRIVRYLPDVWTVISHRHLAETTAEHAE